MGCIQNCIPWISTLSIFFLSFRDGIIIHCTVLPVLCLTSFAWWFQYAVNDLSSVLGSQLPDPFSLVVLSSPFAVTHSQGETLLDHVIPSLSVSCIPLWLTSSPFLDYSSSILTIVLLPHWSLWFYHLFTISYFLHVLALFYSEEFDPWHSLSIVHIFNFLAPLLLCPVWWNHSAT